MKSTATMTAILVVMVPCVLAGCGGRDANLPKLEPVSGTVTLDGQPLSGAVVQFVPVGTTRGSGASAVTGTDGTYSLKSPEGDAGVPAGEYRVVISKEAMPDGSDPPAGVPPADSGAQETLPPKYSDYERSEIKKTVFEGGGTIDIEMKK